MGIFILLAVAGGILVVAGSAAIVYHMQHPQRRTYAFALAHGLPTEPDALGLSYEPQDFHFDDGTRTPGWLIQGRQPTGPIVVVTHGWSSSKYAVLPHANLLADFASKIVLYDMRAHGESTAKSCQLGLAEIPELIQIIQHVDDQQSPFVLMGISMGAGFALLAPTPDHCPDHLQGRIAGVIIQGIYRWPMEPVIGHFRSRQWPPYPFIWLVDAYYRLTTRHYLRFDRAQHAKQLACPLLALHGTDDPISQFDSATQITAAAPNAKLVPFQDAQHSGLINHDHDRYRQALATFFADIEAKPAPPHPATPSAESPAAAPAPPPRTPPTYQPLKSG